MIKKELQKLMKLFPGSFINSSFELILINKTNLYFHLGNVKTVEDLYFKVIAWCSRHCYKSEPFHREWKNKKYREMVREKINAFLSVNFDRNNWKSIYLLFGNAINEEQCRDFICSGFNLDELLKGGAI